MEVGFKVSFSVQRKCAIVQLSQRKFELPLPIVAVNGCQCTSASMIRAASTSRRSSDSGPKYELMHTLFKQWKKIIRIKLGIFIHCSKDQCICYLGHSRFLSNSGPKRQCGTTLLKTCAYYGHQIQTPSFRPLITDYPLLLFYTSHHVHLQRCSGILQT